MVKGKQNIKIIGILCCIFIIIFSLFFMINNYYKDNSYNKNLYALSYDTSEYIYLSDIDYLDESYVEDGYYIRKDKNGSSGLITLNIDGEKHTFIKGISAWATSSLVYDLTNLNYDYFTAYLGVDAKETSTYYNSGVIFTIYLSEDGINYKEAYTSKVLKGWDDAEYVKINISNAKYLKLYAYKNGDSWYSEWYDDAVYANALLVTDGYKEREITDNPLIKRVSEYDNLLKDYEEDIKSGSFNELSKYKLILLQREFVNNVGYDILQSLINYSKDYEEVLSWLINDPDMLELYILGGTPDGNYATSLQVLNELYKEYKNDLDNKDLLSNGDTLGNLYRKMMVTLSLTHSASVGLWVSGAPEDTLDPNGSNALRRYQIYKDLYASNKLDKEIFENLTVEEMRFVMNNIIDDEEIVWLNDYTTLNKSRNPYTYITYRFGYDYNKDIYYSDDKKSEWDNKYLNNITKYNVTYKNGYPKLWIVFEEGSVCGGLSKTGSNIEGVYGIPSTVVSQPGHAAYIYVTLVNGEKVWTLYNDVYGWGQSGKTEKLSVRMPNGWGSGSYAGDYPASYILLSQSALDNYELYKESEEILMSALSYSDDYDTLEKIYENALSIQNINFDAWLGLVNVYTKQNKTDNEIYGLATRIIDNLKYYPLPMYDLINLLDDATTNKSTLAAITNNVTRALEEDANLQDSNLKQESAIKQVAKYLLSVNDGEIATFSFDGENANKIILNERFQGNGVRWQYNLTSNASDWKDVEGVEVLLTESEINLIHEETDISIRIVGDLDNVYNIDIKKSVISPNISQNDLENTITGITDTLEWSIDGNKWTLFSEEKPDLTGNKVLTIREKRHGVYLESESMTFTFTDTDDNEEKSYIPVENLSIDSVSSEELERENNAAKNAIDGNRNTMWHTLWDGTDQEMYIVIALNEAKYVNALEYVPRISSSNGIIKNAKVLVSMDKENWTEVVSSTDWDTSNDSKYVDFEKVELAKYVKIIGVETSGNYMSAAMFNLFEDRTKTSIPTAELSYSETTLTNKDVTVTLINPSKEITILNNNGSDTYTFTENGEFTFEFVDNYGNKNTLTAKVDYIDKILPEGYLLYSTLEDTNKDVTVTLKSDEEIIIINNDGSDTYTFTENGTFEFIYQDLAGNENKTVAKVTWIKSEKDNNSKPSTNKPDKDNEKDKDKDKEEQSTIVNEKVTHSNLLKIIGYAIIISILVGIIIVLIIKSRKKNK